MMPQKKRLLSGESDSNLCLETFNPYYFDIGAEGEVVLDIDDITLKYEVKIRTLKLLYKPF